MPSTTRESRSSAGREPAAHRPLRPLALVGAVVVTLIVSMATATSSAPAASASDRWTLVATDSAWTTSRQAKKPQSTSGLSVTAKQDHAFLKFSGRPLAGRQVTSATLVLRVRSTTATKPGIVVHKTSSSWKSGQVTRSNQPRTTGRPVATSKTKPRGGQVIRIPLPVSAVSTTGTFSYRLHYTQPAIRLMLERSGSKAPRIEVTLAPKPAASPRPTPPPTATPRPTPSPTPSAAPAPTPREQPMVFAHYFTPYPLSLDNRAPQQDYYARHYLSPAGENGKFAARGGLLRDRPLSPPASTASDWRIRNFVTEIEQAKSAGIDGWTLNLLGTSGGNHWNAALEIMQAADRAGGFVVVPMVDATATLGKTGTAESVAEHLRQLYAYDSAYRRDGAHMLSAFKAENRPVSWWSEVMTLLEERHGYPTTFVPVLLDSSEANMRAFAPISSGLSNWGTRTEHGALTRPDYVAMADGLGTDWMEPVAVQDVRFKDGRWAESHNTAAVRAQWERAIRQGADYVQIVTWNDYSESTQIAPSAAHGTAFLDITRYYSSWYRTGTQPRITGDQVVLTHRAHLLGARPTTAHTLMGAPTLGGTSTTPRDSAEALVWLTRAATVELTVGRTTTRFSAPAGVSALTVPLQTGTVSVQVVRGGAVVQRLVSPHEVVATPMVQDLQYHASSTW